MLLLYTVLSVLDYGDDFYCDMCHQMYSNRKCHRVLMSQKVDVTMCDKCYNDYLSTTYESDNIP